MKVQPKRVQWKGIIEDWQASGKSQRAYCQHKGYVYSTFCYWNRRLQQTILRTGTEERVCAVEVGRFPIAPMEKVSSTGKRAVMETEGIVIGFSDCDATITIAGRISLGALGRIFAACEGAANHA